MPHNAAKQQVDDLANERPEKLNLKILLYFALGAIFVIVIMFRAYKVSVEQQIEYLTNDRDLERQEKKEAQKCCLDCNADRIQDFKVNTNRFDTIAKKLKP